MDKNKHYKPESAGQLMLGGVRTVTPDTPIVDVHKWLRKHAENLGTLNYVYITDGQNRLEGVLSLKMLFTSDSATLVSEVMERDVISVSSDEDQETVAKLALEHQLKAVPVVDKKLHLLGVIPSHHILNVLQQEQEEDVLRAAGLPVEALRQEQQRPLSQAWHRLPWLMLGMLGGIAAAVMIGLFEGVLAEEVLLAAFIPAVVYLADAAGVQVQTIYIRLLARKNDIKTLRYLYREILTSLIIAVVLGVSTLGIVAVWFDAGSLALVVALSVAVTIVVASIIAVILPWLFQKLRFDPAVASGPMATIISDVASILIYFTIARYLLRTLA